MTWWAQHGDKVGAAAALAIVAGFGALTRYFSKLNDAKIAAAAAVPAPIAPPPSPPASALAAELEAARIALSGAHLRIDDLHSALRNVREEAEQSLRRQRRTIDELEIENARKSEALMEARALLEAARSEALDLRQSIEGSRHGTESRRSTDDPDRDRRPVRHAGAGWPVARAEVGPLGPVHVPRKAPR